MTPRARIESLDTSEPLEAIGRRLMTCHHNKLPVFEGDIARVLGILHVRKLLPLLGEQSLTAEQTRETMVPPIASPPARRCCSNCRCSRTTGSGSAWSSMSTETCVAW